MIEAFVPGVACTAAVAGLPFLTVDPAPADLCRVKIHSIDQKTRAAGGRVGSVSGKVSVSVGCAAETQCHVAVPLAFNHPIDELSRAGLGDVEIGIKYRVLGRSEDGWSAAVWSTFFARRRCRLRLR